MSVYNRLSRPIGVMCTRDRFLRICDVLELDPHNNDVLRHIVTPVDAMQGEICRFLEVGDVSHIGDALNSYHAIKSLAMSKVRNEARATKIDPRRYGAED